MRLRGIVVSAKRRRTYGTSSIGRTRYDAVDRIYALQGTFYYAINYSDNTTIKGALQIAADLNLKIGRSAITRLISDSGCGFRLIGRRGQWVVNVEKMLPC